MADEQKTEIKNKETVLGNDKNVDGSPIQEVTKDDTVVAEIRTKERSRQR